MLRPLQLSLLAMLAGAVSADTPLWIDRPAAAPWLPAIEAASQRSNLPAPLLAELIGIESGFTNARNPRSSARGFGQQIDGNSVMARYRLDRARPEDSIMGAALQFRAEIDRTGSIAAAAERYGTTAHLAPARKRLIVARLTRAASAVVCAMLPIGADPLLQHTEFVRAVGKRGADCRKII